MKNILVNAGYGELILENFVNEADYTDVSRRALKILDFRIVDVYGSDLELNGAHVSFSLLFVPIPI